MIEKFYLGEIVLRTKMSQKKADKLPCLCNSPLDSQIQKLRHFEHVRQLEKMQL